MPGFVLAAGIIAMGKMDLPQKALGDKTRKKINKSSNGVSHSKEKGTAEGDA